MGNFIEMEATMETNHFFLLMKIQVKIVKYLSHFLYQFYADKDIPPKILVNIDQNFFKEVEITLNKKNKLKTKILKPKSGEKLQHILLAEKNALESIKLKKSSLETHNLALNYHYRNF